MSLHQKWTFFGSNRREKRKKFPRTDGPDVRRTIEAFDFAQEVVLEVFRDVLEVLVVGEDAEKYVVVDFALGILP